MKKVFSDVKTLETSLNAYCDDSVSVYCNTGYVRCTRNGISCIPYRDALRIVTSKFNFTENKCDIINWEVGDINESNCI